MLGFKWLTMDCLPPILPAVVVLVLVNPADEDCFKSELVCEPDPERTGKTDCWRLADMDEIRPALPSVATRNLITTVYCFNVFPHFPVEENEIVQRQDDRVMIYPDEAINLGDLSKVVW
jgi:hypothetical protein